MDTTILKNINWNRFNSSWEKLPRNTLQCKFTGEDTKYSDCVIASDQNIDLFLPIIQIKATRGKAV